MRLSLSTKIFFSFVALILAFGASTAYNLVRTNELRAHIAFVRKGALDLKSRLRVIEDALQSTYEQVLGATPNPEKNVRETFSELDRIRERLPELRFFDPIDRVRVRIGEIVRTIPLLDADRTALLSYGVRIEGLSTSTSLYDALKAEHERRGLGGQPLTLFDAPKRNREVIDAYARAFAQAVDERNYALSATLLVELRQLLAYLIRAVKVERRELNRILEAADDRTTAAEEQATLGAVITASVAVVIGLLMMLLTHRSLRRVDRLIEGAQRLSEGDYAQRVEVLGHDELAAVATEFNRMAERIQERDRLLRAQREELARAERLSTVGAMSAKIVHEIRNPLSSIGLNTELLEEDLAALDLPAGTREGALALLRSIMAEVDRLAGVTEEYLRYARLPKPERKPTALTPLLTSLLAFIGPELDAAGVQVRTRFEGTPTALVDPNQIHQAVLNLVRNAAEALGGSGVIEVALLTRDGCVEIVVRDSGPGIEPEALARLFEPFFTTKAGGTGLGLSLVRQIATDHDGEVLCESQPGEGTEFRLRLPLPSGAA